MLRRLFVMLLCTCAASALAQATRPANLLHNADFEAPPSAAEAIPSWSIVREGDAAGDVSLDAAHPLNEKSPHALHISVTRVGGRMGVSTAGLTVAANQWYEVNLAARTDNNFHVGLVFSLESADGRTVAARVTLPEIGGAWKPYTVALHADTAIDNARLVISPIEPGAIWIDEIALTPRAPQP